MIIHTCDEWITFFTYYPLAQGLSVAWHHQSQALPAQGVKTRTEVESSTLWDLVIPVTSVQRFAKDAAIDTYTTRNSLGMHLLVSLNLQMMIQRQLLNLTVAFSGALGLRLPQVPASVIVERRSFH